MIKLLLSFLLIFTFNSYSQEEIRVSDIKVEGLQRIDPGLIFGNIPFEIDDEISSIDFSKTISLLFKTGQFKDVAVERQGSTIIISVSERPIIYEINYYGTEIFQPENLNEGLAGMNVGTGLVFDKADLVKAEQEIARQYLSRGKYTARVVSEVVPLERNRVNINFYVEEGRVSRIQSIDIVGNRVYKKDDLFEQLTLKTTNFLSWYNKDDRYSKVELSGDLENLKTFYMDRGYLDFKINSTTVSISKNKKNIYIEINIDEGDKYTIGSIKVSGKIPEELESSDKESLSLKDLKDQVLVKEGDIFNRKLINQSSAAMTSKLGDYGFAFANINLIPKIDKVKNIVDFNFLLDPGKKIYVRRINIIGNDKTKDKVIRRELRQLESSWFSEANIQRSRERLSRTQFFDAIDIETPSVPGVSDQIDLNVKIAERNTGSISVGAGLSSSEGIVGTLSVAQANFFGTGNNVSTTISTGDVNSVYSLTFTDPYFTDDGITRGISGYKKTVDTKGQVGQAEYQTDSLGGGLTFIVPITEHDVIVVGTQLDLTELTLSGNAPSAYKNYCTSTGSSTTTCDTSSWLFFTGLEKDTRDDVTFPTTGTKYVINLESTAPVLDVKYYKFAISSEKFFPIGDNLTTRIKGDIGYIDAYGDDVLPFYKRFRVGGQKTIRGFKDGSVGKKVYDTNYKDYITNGGKSTLQLSAETFFPVPGMKRSESIRMSAFFDAGGVFEDSPKISEMRYSVGVAGLWLSPFGPLNISLGLPLNDDEHDKTETFQFGMGTNF
ncbi:outer membrane protein assembly factor BamA [Methylophilaceae bacterium]|nr:outer membrane protein assembly factor BamA [Methylophilaceae bacterium]